MKVQVGTDTQQNDGAQHVVDQVAKLGLQIALPIPEYLKERHLVRNCIKNLIFKELNLMFF